MRGESVTCPRCNSRFTAWLFGGVKKGRKDRFVSLWFKPKDALKQTYWSTQASAADDLL
jgi:hypothetical protein